MEFLQCSKTSTCIVWAMHVYSVGPHPYAVNPTAFDKGWKQTVQHWAPCKKPHDRRVSSASGIEDDPDTSCREGGEEALWRNSGADWQSELSLCVKDPCDDLRSSAERIRTHYVSSRIQRPQLILTLRLRLTTKNAIAANNAKLFLSQAKKKFFFQLERIKFFLHEKNTSFVTTNHPPRLQ